MQRWVARGSPHAFFSGDFAEDDSLQVFLPIPRSGSALSCAQLSQAVQSSE